MKMTHQALHSVSITAKSLTYRDTDELKDILLKSIRVQDQLS